MSKLTKLILFFYLPNVLSIRCVWRHPLEDLNAAITAGYHVVNLIMCILNLDVEKTTSSKTFFRNYVLLRPIHKSCKSVLFKIHHRFKVIKGVAARYA